MSFSGNDTVDLSFTEEARVLAPVLVAASSSWASDDASLSDDSPASSEPEA